jgi:hypothetical protein
MSEKKACNCVSQVEEKTLNHLKENNTMGFIYDDDLNHWNGLGLQNVAYNFETGKSMVYMQFSAMYTFKKTNGELSKPKKHTINLFPNYCPFCGEKLTEDEDKS